MSFISGVYRRKTITFAPKTERESDAEKKLPDDGRNYVWSLFHFLLSEFFNFDNFVQVLYQPACPSSLGVVRALFGLMMIIDIPDERGLANIDLNYGDPMRCHFPLFEWLSPLSLEYMGLLYSIMWLGSLGICLGYKFQFSCCMFIIPYWYIYLLDKSFWNNHSYLYGLVSILFSFTSANYSYSLDAFLDPSIRNKPVPLWNYVMIRFQFFLLYFYAGIKKFDPDWIGGYSMTNLGLHWVFEPFRLVLSNQQIDFWIIHIFGFLFDLTVGFFLLIDKTRPVAMIFSSAFHFMNSCMFHIGQFPYVCLVTTPIFCKFDWPERLIKCMSFKIKKNGTEENSEKSLEMFSKYKKNTKEVTWKQRLLCFTMSLYVIVQLFLPFSHFLTQGYNNWTNGLYGYSWDMMVQNWDSCLIVVKVIDNDSKEEFFIDPEAWVGNTRYSKHGDMLVQYAKCLKRNLNNLSTSKLKGAQMGSFSNIAIHVDVWCSLNGRFLQRMFTPQQDILTAEWNPFSRITWLMPLLSNLSSWRQKLHDIQNEVHSWSNRSEVMFVADFPGLYLENYINPDFTNVTVTVLQGIVVLEQENDTGESRELVNVTLFEGDSSKINEGSFHKIHTISDRPSCYMYIYNNYTSEEPKSRISEEVGLTFATIQDMLRKNLTIRLENLVNSFRRLRDCFGKLIFDIPIPVRYKEVI